MPEILREGVVILAFQIDRGWYALDGYYLPSTVTLNRDSEWSADPYKPGDVSKAIQAARKWVGKYVEVGSPVHFEVHVY